MLRQTSGWESGPRDAHHITRQDATTGADSARVLRDQESADVSISVQTIEPEPEERTRNGGKSVHKVLGESVQNGTKSVHAECEEELEEGEMELEELEEEEAGSMPEQEVSCCFGIWGFYLIQKCCG